MLNVQINNLNSKQRDTLNLLRKIISKSGYIVEGESYDDDWICYAYYDTYNNFDPNRQPNALIFSNSVCDEEVYYYISEDYHRTTPNTLDLAKNMFLILIRDYYDYGDIMDMPPSFSLLLCEYIFSAPQCENISTKIFNQIESYQKNSHNIDLDYYIDLVVDANTKDQYVNACMNIFSYCCNQNRKFANNDWFMDAYELLISSECDYEFYENLIKIFERFITKKYIWYDDKSNIYAIRMTKKNWWR